MIWSLNYLKLTIFDAPSINTKRTWKFIVRLSVFPEHTYKFTFQSLILFKKFYNYF